MGRGGSERYISLSETRFSLLHCRYVNHSAIYAGLGDTICHLRPVFDFFAGLGDTICRLRPVFDFFAGLRDTICRLRPVFDFYAGLGAHFCAHRPESTVCNIIFAEAKVSMKQRRTRMLACCGRICSMRTRLQGIVAISISPPALISNIIRNTLGKFMWKCRWKIRLRKM